MTQYFKKYGEAPHPHLAGMAQRKQAVTDIHLARVNATMQSAAIPSGLDQWYDANDGLPAPQAAQPSTPTEVGHLPEPTAEALPAPTGPPAALGPRPDRIGAAVRATSAGVRLVGGAARATWDHATVGSQMLLGAGIRAGISATPMISAVGDILSAAGPPVLAGGSAVVSGLGHAAVHTAVIAGPPLLAGGVALASGLGHVAVGVAEGAGSMAGAVAHGVATHGPEIYYMGSSAFKELYDLISRLPEIPSLDAPRGSDLALYTSDAITPWSTGHSLAHNDTVARWSSPVNNALTYGNELTYGNMKDKRRSSSPRRAAPPYTPTAPRKPTGYHAHHDSVITRNTATEWGEFGRGVLGNQLMMRPGYNDAIQGMNHAYTTKILAKLSPAEMIHLILKLDGKL